MVERNLDSEVKLLTDGSITALALRILPFGFAFSRRQCWQGVSHNEYLKKKTKILNLRSFENLKKYDKLSHLFKSSCKSFWLTMLRKVTSENTEPTLFF